MHICCIYVRQDITLSGEVAHFKIRNDNIPMGISYISSCLKQAGYTTEMVYCTRYTYNIGISKYIEKEPQVFGISIVSNEDLGLSIELIKTIKKEYKNAKIIIGGQLVTVDVENIYKKIDCVDALCIGAGEKAVVEYVQQVEQGKYKKTDNLWIKDNSGQIIKCDKVVSIENVDELPYPDRDGWKKWTINTKIQSVILTRGCIYDCIFCANGALKKSSGDKYYIERNIWSVIEEIKYIIEKYDDVEYIELLAANALSNISNIRQFCIAMKDCKNKFGRRIFFDTKINFTPNLLDKDVDVLYLMKEANIENVRFSLESGSVEIRKLLKKPYYTNEQIIQFFKKLREIGIRSVCYFMYNYPFETKQTYLETIECLRKSKPDINCCSFLTPLKHTELVDILARTKHKKVSFIDKYRFYTVDLRIFWPYKSVGFILNFYLLKIKFIQKIYNFYKRKKNIDNNDIKILEKGKEFFNNGKYKEAIKYFNKIRISKDIIWVYGDIAVAKMNIGDYKGALKYFDKVLKLDPSEIYKEKREECLKKMGENK